MGLLLLIFSVGVGSGGVGLNGMDRECELFLRVLVEFWLEGNAVHRPGFPREVTCKKRADERKKSSMTCVRALLLGSELHQHRSSGGVEFYR